MIITVVKLSAIRVSVTALGLLLLLACGCRESQDQPRQETLRVIKIKKNGLVAENPLIKPNDDSPRDVMPPASAPVFTTRGIDPFVPLVQIPHLQNTATDQVKPTRPSTDRGPLSKIDLARVAVKAVVRTDTGPMALLEELSRRGHVVKTGDRVGTPGHRIVSINLDGIVLETMSEDSNAEIKRQTMRIRPTDVEQP